MGNSNVYLPDVRAEVAFWDTPSQIMEIFPFTSGFFWPTLPPNVTADTRNITSFHSEGLETVSVPFRAVSGICLTLWALRQLLTFPKNKHLLWIHSVSFRKCQNNWNPPQSAFKTFSVLHLLSHPVPEVCQSSHYTTTCVYVYVRMHLPPLLPPSHPHHESVHITFLCFLLTLHRMFYKTMGQGLEEMFLLNSHQFCHLHIFLNLHICDWQEQEYIINYAAGHRYDSIIYFTFYYSPPSILLLFYRFSGVEGMNTQRCWLTAAQEGKRKGRGRGKNNWEMN